jgi:hypothetical protein
MHQKPIFTKSLFIYSFDSSTLFEKFLQFPFKEAVVSNLFYVSREFIVEVATCSNWFTVMKFKLMC